jgi:hypothetical protein
MLSGAIREPELPKDTAQKMDGTPKTILLVENDKMIRDMVESLGHRCLEAANVSTCYLWAYICPLSGDTSPCDLSEIAVTRFP